MEMEKVGFDFSEGYERKILKTFITDTNFFSLYIDLLDSKYFTNPIRQYIAALLKDYYVKYHKQPSMSFFENQKSQRFPEVMYRDEFNLIKNVVTNDYEYTRDLFVKFMRTQSYKKAIQQAVSLVQQGRTDEIDFLIKSASEVGRVHEDLGLDYFATFMDRTKEPKPGYDYIPTGYKRLDDVLEGGLYVGTLGMILALQGVGKSFCLQNFCKAAALLHLHTVYYTLEMSADAVARRLDMSFTGKTKKEIYKYPNKTAELLEQKHEKAGKEIKIIIKEGTEGQFSIADLRSHLKMLVSEGIPPKVIFVDYAALLKASNKRDEFRFQLKEIYEGLRGIAKEFRIAVWTAHQAPKGSENKSYLSLGDVGEATWVSAVCDVIIALNQTPEEREDGIFRFGFLKLREQQLVRDVLMLADLKTMRIREEEDLIATLRERKEQREQQEKNKTNGNGNGRESNGNGRTQKYDF